MLSEEDLQERASAWQEDDASIYEWACSNGRTRAAHMRGELTRVASLVQVTSNMPLFIGGSSGGAAATTDVTVATDRSGSDDRQLVDELQRVCKALMVVACLEDVMEDDEQYHNSVKLCLEAFSRREHFNTPQRQKLMEREDLVAIGKLLRALESGIVLKVDNLDMLIEHTEQLASALMDGATQANEEGETEEEEEETEEEDATRWHLTGGEEINRILNGETDWDARELLIHKAYVGVFGRRAFMAAL
eukprot:7384824-Prymnesium_polylepis.1